MDYVKSAVAQNFGGPAHRLAPKNQEFSLEEVPDLSGKVAVVTGGSEGIGYGCAHTLLAHNISKLFILSKSEEIVDSALAAVKEQMGTSAAEKVTWIKCNLSDWPTITAAASQISNSTDRLDILINTAARGIMTFQLSPYGVDEHIALNHIGHVILNSHLMPILKKTASAGNTVRIVTYGSNLHQQVSSSTRFASLDELNTDLGPNQAVRTIQACRHPLRTLPRPASLQNAPQHPRQHSPPWHRGDAAINRAHPRSVPHSRVRHERGFESVQEGAVYGCGEWHVCGDKDDGDGSIYLSACDARAGK